MPAHGYARFRTTNIGKLKPSVISVRINYVVSVSIAPA